MAEIEWSSLYKPPSDAIIASRRAFYSLKRGNNDSIQTWFERVQRHINRCKFPKIIEYLLIDKFMCGLSINEIKSIRRVDTWSFIQLHEYLENKQIPNGQTNTNANIAVNQNIDPAEQTPEIHVKYEFNESENHAKNAAGNTTSENIDQENDVEIKPVLHIDFDPLLSNRAVDIAEASVCNSVPDETNLDDVDEMIINGMEYKVEAYEYPVCDPADVVDNDNNGNRTIRSSRAKQNENNQLKDAHKCEQCQSYFAKRSSLSRHLKMHTGVKFICDYCQKSFALLDNLRTHMKSVHLKLRPHICDQCGRSFAKTSTLNSHRKFVHFGIRQHVCEVCGRKFKRSKSLKYHLHVHTGVKRKYSCDICDSSYHEFCNLKQHIETIHMKIRRHSCHLCAKSFTTESGLQIHIKRVHFGIRRHECKECGEKFKARTKLKLHMIEHSGMKPLSCENIDRKNVVEMKPVSHIEFDPLLSNQAVDIAEASVCNSVPDETNPNDVDGMEYKVEAYEYSVRDPADVVDNDNGENRPDRPSRAKRNENDRLKDAFKCEQCQSHFATRSGLSRHLKRHAGAEFICDLCQKSFALLDNLRAHMKCVHLKLRPYICDQCGKSFAKTSTLNSHRRFVHFGIRAHECKECGRKFKRSKSLKYHLHVHTGVKRKYSCDICDSSYHEFCNLKQHIETIHMKIRRHSCHLCAKSFTTEGVLQIHIKRVHFGIRHHECKECGEKFKARSKLKLHMIEHSGMKPLSCGICKKFFADSFRLRMHKERFHQ